MWGTGIILVLLFLFYNPNPLQAQRELVLRFLDGTHPDTITAIREEFNATELDMTPISLIRLWQLDSMFIDPITDEAFFLVSSDTLNIQESVKKARRKLSMMSAGINKETFLPEQYDANNTSCLNMVDLPDGMECDVTVAIIDSGVDDAHADLGGWLWENPIEYPLGLNSADEDLNFYKDDLIGYDFSNKYSMPTDYQSHGTHINGTIMQIANNHLGYGIRMMNLKALNAEGTGTIFAAIEAIDYAIAHNAQIINMSLGYIAERPSGPSAGKPFPMEYAIELAGSMKKILVVCSAGNDGLDIDYTVDGYYPAGFDSDNLISVAATDCSTPTLLSFSNHGHTSVDIGAPGIIYSTVLNNLWDYKAGTSMAAAVVSGAAALLGTHLCAFDYNLIKPALLATADPGGLPVATTGTLNGIAALDYLIGPPASRLAANEEKEPLTILPNPFQDQFQINWQQVKEGSARIEIYNSLGQLVQLEKRETQIGYNEVLIDWKSTALTGVFSVLVHTNGKVISKTLIRQTDR